MAKPHGPPERRAPTAGLTLPRARRQGGWPIDTTRGVTTEHAQEVKAVAGGKSVVEQIMDAERRPPAFDRKELMVVRSWKDQQPLESSKAATAMVQYPRLWTTKRGRYCKFRAPGAGCYALLRARPTF